MLVKIFTLRFNPATEAFDDAAVTAFFADKDVCAIRDHFFVKDDIPYLTLVVRYRPGALPPPAAPRSEGRQRDESWRETLSDEDWPLFNTLRDWRGERAKAEGIPPYVICIYIWINAPTTKARESRFPGLLSVSVGACR